MIQVWVVVRGRTSSTAWGRPFPSQDKEDAFRRPDSSGRSGALVALLLVIGAIYEAVEVIHIIPLVD